MRAQASSWSAGFEDVLASSAGAQDARATFSSATDGHAAAECAKHVASRPWEGRQALLSGTMSGQVRDR